MIGTTFKLGFDGTSVSRGLGRVTGMLSKGMNAIGRGGLERVGHGVTDLMGRIVMAVPEALKSTADWAGNMTDMSMQTGVSIEKLVLMEEKLRLAGASASDTSRIISNLANNLHTAATDGGPATDALNKLGLKARDFVGIPIDEAFEKIGRTVADLGPEFAGLDSIMADIFGAKMGYKLIRFFKDFDGSTRQAENNVGKLGGSLNNGLAADLDKFSDAMGRFENFKRSLASMALGEMFRVTGGAGGVDSLFDSLDPEKLRPKIQELMSMLGRNTEVFLSQDLSKSLGEVFKNLGRSIGEGFKESFNPKSFLPKWMGGDSASTGGAPGGDTASLLKDSNQLLKEIRDKSVAKFA